MGVYDLIVMRAICDCVPDICPKEFAQQNKTTYEIALRAAKLSRLNQFSSHIDSLFELKQGARRVDDNKIRIAVLEKRASIVKKVLEKQPKNEYYIGKLHGYRQAIEILQESRQLNEIEL